jgi:hypothetical protein
MLTRNELMDLLHISVYGRKVLTLNYDTGATLLAYGLVESAEEVYTGAYNITPKGEVFLAKLDKLPLPVQKWTMP